MEEIPLGVARKERGPSLAARADWIQVGPIWQPPESGNSLSVANRICGFERFHFSGNPVYRDLEACAGFVPERKLHFRPYGAGRPQDQKPRFHSRMVRIGARRSCYVLASRRFP